MSQGAMANASNSRAYALERRKALSAGGKAALKNQSRVAEQSAGASRTKGITSPQSVSHAPAVSRTPSDNSARSASLARRKAMSSRGKMAVDSRDRVRTAPTPREPQATTVDTPATERVKADCGCGCGGASKAEISSAPATAALKGGGNRAARVRNTRRPVNASSTAKVAALARRKALSSRGKAGMSSSGMSEAQAARASNPRLSGRELAQVIREQRSRRGGAGQKKSAPCGRQRKSKNVAVGAAQDTPWKVGASETSSGQTVTGTMVGRHIGMTGDEPSTCRSITGTEYLGADIFREFCQSDPQASAAKKVTVTTTSHGNNVSGNRMGRASNVTGNEPGTCKRVTGAEYVSAEQTQGYCGELATKSPRKVSMTETMKGKTVTGNNVGRSERVTGDEYGMRRLLTGTQYSKPADIGDAPSKVGVSATLRGGSVTGTVLGRRDRMTGDEPGSCRNITGDEYIGQEQYSEFCPATPQPEDRKVGVSETLAGRIVTGSLAGRSRHVTGDEPGTCKAVTGTPYAGGEQYREYCESSQMVQAQARMQPATKTWGKPMTGQQPGIGGHLTGAAKGVCETVSGTPYVGADQVADACPATAAEPNSPDFPQLLGQTPWGEFSVTTPAHASQQEKMPSQVTGSQSERGDITGPFGMATGKVTGTEQARFDRPRLEPEVPSTAETLHGRVKSRITGEGMDAGQRITGDDWDRGDHVTGTEGASATRRNPTLRGGTTGAMPARAAMVRPVDVPEPVSKVTGGSGNTEKGSLITYSGGARG